jgi:hypothetical protein
LDPLGSDRFNPTAARVTEGHLIGFFINLSPLLEQYIMLATHPPRDVQKLTSYDDVQVMSLENLPNELLEEIFSRMSRNHGE